MTIFSDPLIELIFADAEQKIKTATINKSDLKQETAMFEMAIHHVVNHPWKEEKIDSVHADTSSVLYKKIHRQFVGDDPEEDYRDVFVWKIAHQLYVTAALDHDPDIPVQWDVVVYEDGQPL